MVEGETCSGKASWVESKLEEVVVVTCSGKALWVVAVSARG